MPTDYCVPEPTAGPSYFPALKLATFEKHRADEKQSEFAQEPAGMSGPSHAANRPPRSDAQCLLKPANRNAI
jgi:hypothetical protein